MGEWKSVGYICVYLTSQAAVKAVSTSMHHNLLSNNYWRNYGSDMRYTQENIYSIVISLEKSKIQL